MTSYFPYMLERIFRGDVSTLDIEVKRKIKPLMREIYLVSINQHEAACNLGKFDRFVYLKA
jgi:hypothetical protein